MKDQDKTKAQLIEELAELHQRMGDAPHTHITNQWAALLNMSRAVQEIEQIGDLKRVVGVLFEQMKTIGLVFSGLDFQRLIDVETRTFEMYGMRPDGTYRKYTNSRPTTFDEWQKHRVLYRRDLSKPEYREGLEEGYQGAYRDLGIEVRCILHVPNRYGLLTLRSETANAFSDAEMDFVRDLTEMLGLGISHVEGLEQLGAKNEELGRINASLKVEIAEHKRTEEELQESELLLQESQRVAGLGSYVLDITTGIWTGSEILLDVFGIDINYRTDVEGWLQIVHPEDREMMQNHFSVDVLTKHQLFNKEYRIVRIDDRKIRWLHGLGKLELSSDGNPVKMVGTIQDITEHKQMEQELVRLERLHALGEMSAGVSHNLNNMLTSVLGPAQNLLWATDDPGVRETVGHIIDSARRASDLVHRLHLSTKGVEEDALQPVQVNQMIEEAVQTVRPRWKDEPESRGITVEVVTNLGEVPAIKGTETRLHDIIINLVINAVYAMPEGGTVSIGTQTVEDNVQITVSDTGIGMDEETRRRVFEPFFTTKMDVGSGLGLSTVYGTVTQWRGDIGVESAPGEGTTFTIQLPVWEEIEAQVEAVAEPSRSVRRAKLLIVDDDEGVCNFLLRLFGKNHEVEFVLSGWEALERFAPGRYDVALIDQGMPGMPGDQVVREMQRADPDLVTVLITGWELDAGDPRVSVYDLHIQKPFESLERLEDVVAQAVCLHDARVEGKS